MGKAGAGWGVGRIQAEGVASVVALPSGRTAGGSGPGASEAGRLRPVVRAAGATKSPGKDSDLVSV